jgi:hypothetical protein
VSEPVGLDELWARIDEFGGSPYLVTAAGDGRPHITSVRMTRDGDAIVVDAGRTSRSNIEVAGAASLMWPAPPGGPYSLIVDATGVLDASSDAVTFTPTRAVLHRVAGADESLPSCVKLVET